MLTCCRCLFYRLSRCVLARVTWPLHCGVRHTSHLGCNGQSRSGNEGHLQMWTIKDTLGVSTLCPGETSLSALPPGVPVNYRPFSSPSLGRRPNVKVLLLRAHYLHDRWIPPPWLKGFRHYCTVTAVHSTRARLSYPAGHATASSVKTNTTFQIGISPSTEIG